MFTTKLLANIKLPYKVNINVDFPPIINHDGDDFIQTGKKGNRLIDGMPSAEYENVEGSRIWMHADGSFGDA